MGWWEGRHLSFVLPGCGSGGGRLGVGVLRVGWSLSLWSLGSSNPELEALERSVLRGQLVSSAPCLGTGRIWARQLRSPTSLGPNPAHAGRPSHRATQAGHVPRPVPALSPVKAYSKGTCVQKVQRTCWKGRNPSLSQAPACPSPSAPGWLPCRTGERDCSC